MKMRVELMRASEGDSTLDSISSVGPDQQRRSRIQALIQGWSHVRSMTVVDE